MSYQFVYLTEPSALQEGLYWARRIKGEADAAPKGGAGDRPGAGKWSIICVVGIPPFLDGYLLASSSSVDPEEPWRMGYTSGDKWDRRVRPNEWEFGPRIEVPSPKANVSYPPVAMERQP